MKFTSSISRIGTHGIFADGGAFVPTQEKKKLKSEFYLQITELQSFKLSTENPLFD